jgi:hypothetical protein
LQEPWCSRVANVFLPPSTHLGHSHTTTTTTTYYYIHVYPMCVCVSVCTYLYTYVPGEVDACERLSTLCVLVSVCTHTYVPSEADACERLSTPREMRSRTCTSLCPVCVFCVRERESVCGGDEVTHLHIAVVCVRARARAHARGRALARRCGLAEILKSHCS